MLNILHAAFSLYDLASVENKTRLKTPLFNKTRLYNIHIFNKIIFFKYRAKLQKQIKLLS